MRVLNVAMFTLLSWPTISAKESSCKSLEVDVSSTAFGWHLQIKSFRDDRHQRLGFDPFCDRQTMQGKAKEFRCANPKLELPEKEEGLSMTVINERNGTVTLQKIFRTWEFWTHWSNLLWYVKNVPAGRIIAFSFSGTGSIGLRHATTTLSSLGSNLVLYLTKQNNWIWIFIKSGQTIFEASSLKRYPPLHANLNLSLQDMPKQVAVRPIDKLRMKVCHRNELMGELCEENSIKNFWNIKPSVNITFDNLRNVPVVVTAGSRPHYFYFSMKTLLETPGVNPAQIIVILGGEHQVYVDLLNLLNLKYIVLTLYWSSNAQLFQYYRRVYSYVSETFPHAQAAIFLDEDVEVSPDFFFYMNQTIPILIKDESLYCINSYSSVRSNQLAYESSMALRSISQVAWGYAVTLSFINEALQQWTKTKYDALFDMWLLLSVSNGRECIYPEQTRSRHFGIDGVNFEATFMSESYSVFLPLLKSYGIPLQNLDKLFLPDWRKEITKDINSAKVLTGNPCSADFLPKDEQGTFVSYFRLQEISEAHLGDFQATGICLGVWTLSYQGLHNGVYTLRPRNGTLLHMVGVPTSAYSYLMPSKIKPWTFNALNNSEKHSVLKYKDRLAEREVELYENMRDKYSDAFRVLFRQTDLM